MKLPFKKFFKNCPGGTSGVSFGHSDWDVYLRPTVSNHKLRESVAEWEKQAIL